jgi:predicted O-linked N-acetylglucosamine transferase (SPINDLY family)
MALIQEMLSEALQHHQAGRLPEAEALYRQVLQAHPDHHEALYRLGLIAHQTGRHDDAVEYLGRAIRLNPGVAEYHNNIGTVYKALGKLEEAVVHYRQALNYYGRIDIALDPFPYTGGLSTCEALWMGVPVITLVGSSFLSRIGGSLLTHAGLTEAVTCSPAQYVERAVKWGKDLEHLSCMRLGLRARVAASLCDADTFVHNLEQAYQAMWRRWCESAT